jgi:hypothetical protein
MPVAISDKVLIEQGATIMPITGNEPLEMDAPMSVFEWQTLAIARTSATL